MILIHLPGLPPEPDRWVNIAAIEWAAPMGTGTAIRLRTGDTIKTSMGIMSIIDLMGEIEADEKVIRRR